MYSQTELDTNCKISSSVERMSKGTAIKARTTQIKAMVDKASVVKGIFRIKPASENP